MKISPLTSSEKELMLLLWKLESAFMREIMQAHQEPRPHQNTISTYLKILVDKGFLRTEKHGRIFRYSPAIGKQDYLRYELEQLLGEYFSGDGNALVAFLLQQRMIEPIEETSPTEIIELAEKQVPSQEEEKNEALKEEIAQFVRDLVENTKPNKKKNSKKKKAAKSSKKPKDTSKNKNKKKG